MMMTTTDNRQTGSFWTYRAAEQLIISRNMKGVKGSVEEPSKNYYCTVQTVFFFTWRSNILVRMSPKNMLEFYNFNEIQQNTTQYNIMQYNVAKCIPALCRIFIISMQNIYIRNFNFDSFVL